MASKPQTVPVFDTLERLEDPRWLESVLCRSGRLEPSGSVTTVTLQQLGEGRGIGAQLQRIQAVDQAGRTHRLVAKTPIVGDLRPLADASGIYERELIFYESLAGSCPLQTPTVVFAGSTTTGSDFAIVFEDLDDRADLRPFDQIDGMSLADAFELVPSLAAFHRWSWGLDPSERAALPCLRDIVATAAPMVPLGWAKYLTVADHPVPGQLTAIADRFSEFVDLMPGDGDARQLIHGDLRADNLYRRDDGAFLFIDFQMVCRATGIIDLAYFASQSIAGQPSAEDHRSVLAAYLDAMEQREDERTWHTYRTAVGLYLFIPALAMLTWDTAGDHGRSMALTLMRRWMYAAEAVDAGSVLRA